MTRALGIRTSRNPRGSPTLVAPAPRGRPDQEARTPAPMHDPGLGQRSPREAARASSRASAEMVAVFYETLRTLAASMLSRSASARSLPPTALVHETWLRLCRDAPATWESRRHFLGVASRAMREILIERERARRALRRGGGWARVELDEGTAAVDSRAPDWIALSESLARLEEQHARKSEVVHLRFFAGLTIDETARALDVSAATVERDWEYAKAWLHRDLAGRDRTEDVR
jgi:RNA polymerase sigma factor (TIGR02999 family)